MDNEIIKKFRSKIVSLHLKKVNHKIKIEWRKKYYRWIRIKK